MLQFNRECKLILGNDLVGLRVQFHIEKEMTANGASKCEIKVYNLSQDHLNAIEVGKIKQNVVLSAGYTNNNQSNVKMLYSGPIFYGHSERVGPDIVTTLEMLPGSIVLGPAYVTVQGAQTDLAIYNLVTDQLAKFGVVKGHFSDKVQSILAGGSYRGHSDLGTSSKFLDQICRRHGLRWNTENGQLNIFADGEFENDQFVVLTPTTGLIGIPSKTQDGNYKMRALINPDLSPGRKIRVDTTEFPLHSDLKIFKATYDGDSFSGDWFVDLECTQQYGAPSFAVLEGE